MAESSRLEAFFEAVDRLNLWTSSSAFRTYVHYLFDGVELDGKTFLDVGAGSGQFGFYAAAAGAREVICLEPEEEGSRQGMQDDFRRRADSLGLSNTELQPVTFQEFSPQNEPMDVVFMHNSINHLEEDACSRAHQDPAARELYIELFRKLYGIMSPGGVLIAADCTRHNFFNAIGLRSPVQKTIEWEKHQSPQTWADLLEKAGFHSPRIRWTSFNTLGQVGRVLLGNAVAAYFLTSHFCLTMRKG